MHGAASVKRPPMEHRLWGVGQGVSELGRSCAEEREESARENLFLEQDERAMQKAQGILNWGCGYTSAAALVQVAPNRSCNATALHAWRHKRGGHEGNASSGNASSGNASSGHRPRLALLMDALPSGCQITQEECPQLVAELAQIEGEINDNRMRLKAEARERAKDCDDNAQFAHVEMVGASRLQADLQEELSGATASLSSLTYREEELEEQRKRDEEDLHDAKAQCEEDVHRTLSGTICGLTKVRDSLWLLAGAQELPVDCEVTDWADHACSASCGKGTRESIREVIVEAQNGAECPPLSMVQECEEAACPTDCKVSEWSGWSKCSAVCDSGVQERTRSALTEAKNGGDACPQLVETQLCGQTPCDRDCKLGGWSAWSPCDKMCGGGTQHRKRDVVEPAIGGGTCDQDASAEAQACNQNPCSPTASYTCSGALEDIVLVVDTSGSVDAAGLAKLVELVTAMLDGYAPADGAANVAVVAMGKTAIKVSGLKADKAELTSRINSGGLDWRQGFCSLGSSLALAATVLRQEGRRGALPTVVVLAGGQFSDTYEAQQAKRRLEQRGARVVLAVVGQEKINTRLLGRFATDPPSDNLISIPTLASADDVSSAASKIVAGTCSAVV